ncbi:hypothetical protein [Mucilaginibacter sp.]|uniref:hypothetical protein n=1 Tax=Mucilaginibacter sp. TaxID=1882438 RepID=UPI0025EBA484|nr:hypothetical protein [Mucilaginibacter sp.]
MITIDLYSEHYKGELEVVLIEKVGADNIVYEVRLFQADFSGIIDWIPYDETSDPENLVRLLNIANNYGSTFSLVVRLQEFYDQLLTIVDNLAPSDLQVYSAIKSICESAIEHENRLFIKRNS